MIKISFIFMAVFLIPLGSTTAQAEPIKLSYNSDWPPYSSGIGSKVNGILPDLMREIIEKRMGQKVEQSGAAWKRAQLMVEKGLADAFVTVPTNKRKKYANSSLGIVYSLEMRAVVKKDSAAHISLKSDSGIKTFHKLRVCDILGNGFAQNFYGKHKINFMTASNVSACLRMESIDRADVLIQPLAIVSTAIKASNLNGVLITLPNVYAQMDFTLLLSKKSSIGPNFVKKFDAALAEMKKDGSYDALVQKLRAKVY
jgi:polar amino acid transport system substrate-binding protein